MAARDPTATYRLQLNARFTLRDALGLVDYLRDLGISEIYLSPVTAARPGSPHGYDVIDSTRLNPDLGSIEDFAALSNALRKRGMGLLLDVVPNHMCATDSGNRWWQDVLERGPQSPYAKYFDIDFHPAKIDLHDKILLPILGDQFGKVLENQEIQISYDQGAFHARYGSHVLPLALESWTRILEPAVESLRAQVSPESPDLLRLDDVLLRIRERHSDYEARKAAVEARLRALYLEGNGAREALDSSIRRLNGKKGDPRSFDAMETLLFEQPYRVSFWRVAADEVNYRRFFDINDLVALRVEEPEVFRATHELLLQFVRSGWLTGVRVDHVDGLLQPVHYLESVRKLVREAGADGSFMILVEKILDQNERLDPRWPAEGTTGYEFLSALNGVFIHPQGLHSLETFYERHTRRFESPAETIARSKRLILASSMAGELHVLAMRLDRISEQHRSSRDFTGKSLEGALAEVIACFPVYRTYADGQGPVEPYDRSIIQAAVATAKARNAATNESIFSFIEDVLLLEGPDGLSDLQRTERANFLLRFQQLSGPVMAKGLEDTACYRRYPLASLCEVGGGPDRDAVSVAEFHEFNLRRQTRWAKSLSATTTHDTKRSEDVRARLNVLSELPEEWAHAVEDWTRRNAGRKRSPGTCPDANEEYLIYQTLVSTLPEGAAGQALPEPYLDRLAAYFLKALREARIHSSWISPNPRYESAAIDFVRSVLSPDHGFLPELRRFVDRIRPAALFNSLGQTLLKITCPGIPDIYQGSEFMDFRLTDPDNREPVDFEARRRALSGLGEASAPGLIRDLVDRGEEDRLKLLLTREFLGIRHRRAGLFLRGDYVPLEPEGPASENLIAFARRDSGSELVVLVGRFLASRAVEASTGQLWKGTRVKGFSGSRYLSLLSGARFGGGGALDLSGLLAPLPLALLERVP